MVPGEVHLDLMRHGLIPDPRIGSNIDSVQWVEQVGWTYTCRFHRGSVPSTEHVDLVLGGLDTYAEVRLNGRTVLQADNMFRTWRVDVKQALVPGMNRLEVAFLPVAGAAGPARAAYGLQLPHDSDPSGLAPYMRKAACQSGWDFVPRLVGCGIWKAVGFECWDGARIADVALRTAPVAGTVEVSVASNGLVAGAVLRVRVRVDDGPWSTGPLTATTGGTMAGRLHVPLVDTARWWPRGTGPRPMKDLEVELLDGSGAVLDRRTRRFGVRTIVLDQRSDSVGAAFTFVVNGTPVFMKGANVVPPTVFLSQATDSAWVMLVDNAVRAGMNMLRVWGGGMYPPDAFFHACDTAGILIWQDFMFGYIPPAGDRVFMENILVEAEQQARRLAHHPSLALLCGNNELDVAWRNWGWQARYGLHGADSARVREGHESLFGTALRAVAEREGVAYVRTSPLSNWGAPAGLRSGSLHYWGVWHADSTFASYERNIGRFMAEFGFQSWPDSLAMAPYLVPEDLALGSPALRARQRSYRTDRPIMEAMLREFGSVPSTYGAYAERSQELQALAMATAVEAHLGWAPWCMGSLVWQLNGPWPGPNWSLLEPDGRWRPAMHRVSAIFGRSTGRMPDGGTGIDKSLGSGRSRR